MCVCFYPRFLGECLQRQELFSEHVAQISRDNAVNNTSRWDHTHTHNLNVFILCVYPFAPKHNETDTPYRIHLL